jgi:hypothetical protein
VEERKESQARLCGVTNNVRKFRQRSTQHDVAECGALLPFACSAFELARARVRVTQKGQLCNTLIGLMNIVIKLTRCSGAAAAAAGVATRAYVFKFKFLPGCQ